MSNNPYDYANQVYNALLGQQGAQNGYWQSPQAFYSSAALEAYQRAAYQSALNAAQQIAAQPPEPKPIPNEGIRAGEIIGWRAWGVDSRGFLKSVSADRIWAPGEDMEGDVEKAGIHCFKTQSEVLSSGYSQGSGTVAVGTIWLWGEIIEHERGYRAQFASIRSLDYAFVPPTDYGAGPKYREQWWQFWRRDPPNKEIPLLTRLRELYGVATPPIDNAPEQTP